MSKFQAQVQADVVKLGGVIDEDNELEFLVDKIPRGTVFIDLGDVERINSCGVRDWVNWLGKIEKNGSRGVLVACSPAIVAQINIVNNFTGSGAVKSFYVPYFCPECDEEKVLLVEAAEMGPPPHEPPTCRCDECDLVMDFDDMPDSYFAFLSNQKKVVELAARAAMGGPPPGARVRSRGSAPLLDTAGTPAPASAVAATMASGVRGPRASVPSLPSAASGGIKRVSAYGGSGQHAAIQTSASGSAMPPAVANGAMVSGSHAAHAPMLHTPTIGANIAARRGNGLLYVVLLAIGVAVGLVVYFVVMHR